MNCIEVCAKLMFNPCPNIPYRFPCQKFICLKKKQHKI